MSEYKGKTRKGLNRRNINAEFLSFDECVHTVAQVVEVSGYPVERFTKSIVMVTRDYQMVIEMVPTDCRASAERVKKALQLNERPKVATAEQTVQ